MSPECRCIADDFVTVHSCAVDKSHGSNITELQGTAVPLWPAYIGFLAMLAMEGADRRKEAEY